MIRMAFSNFFRSKNKELSDLELMYEDIIKTYDEDLCPLKNGVKENKVE